MLKQTVVLSLLAGLLLLPCTGEAALKPARKTTAAALSPADCCNPRPASDDIELPMPCGMTMVLRPVAIPVSGFLGDKQFPMGLSSTEEGRSLYEKQMAAHISAPFRQENLPAAWSGKLPADEKDAYCYYFIGKYEITRAQWAAVMEGKEVTEGGNLPVSDISWYDLQEFFRKYNEWLLSSHVDAVPRIDNVPAFLRLPTEAEWTAAAISAQHKGYTSSLLSIDNDTSAPSAMMGQLWEFTSDAFIPLSRLIDQAEVERLSQLYPYDDVIVKGGSWINTPDTVSPDTVGVMDRSACSVYAGFRIGTR